VNLSLRAFTHICPGPWTMIQIYILTWFPLSTRTMIKRKGSKCRHHVSSSSFFLLLLLGTYSSEKSFLLPLFFSSLRLPSGQQNIYIYVVLLLYRVYDNSRSFSLYFVVKGCCVLVTFCSSFSHYHVTSAREQIQREWKIDFLFSLIHSLVAFGACFCCLENGRIIRHSDALE